MNWNRKACKCLAQYTKVPKRRRHEKKARNVDPSGNPFMKATCLMNIAAITAAVPVVKEILLWSSHFRLLSNLGVLSDEQNFTQTEMKAQVSLSFNLQSLHCSILQFLFLFFYCTGTVQENTDLIVLENNWILSLFHFKVHSQKFGRLFNHWLSESVGHLTWFQKDDIFFF